MKATTIAFGAHHNACTADDALAVAGIDIHCITLAVREKAAGAMRPSMSDAGGSAMMFRLYFYDDIDP